MPTKKKTGRKQDARVPECRVTVKNLSLEEISRMTVSPYFVSNRCGRCQKLSYYGPKCTTCSVSYHYDCAIQRGMCCELPILIQDKSTETCPRCLESVQFGTSCTVCHSKFHTSCLTPYDQCCNLALCRKPLRRPCGRCQQPTDVGPRCPFCASIFHPECLRERPTCCDHDIVVDDSKEYHCRFCGRRLGLGCSMCLLCGALCHNYCLSRARGVSKCCRKRIPLEIFFVPSFKYVINHFRNFATRKTQLTRQKIAKATRDRILRGINQDMNDDNRTKKKSASCQTNDLDRIEIVSVKTEVELDIPPSPPPPLLHREMSSTSGSSSFTPESSSTFQKLDDEGNSLKELFEFLYGMVKKFPPHLQTQVKIDLFKTVTEAEMRLQCETVESQISVTHV